MGGSARYTEGHDEAAADRPGWLRVPRSEPGQRAFGDTPKGRRLPGLRADPGREKGARKRDRRPLVPFSSLSLIEPKLLAGFEMLR